MHRYYNNYHFFTCAEGNSEFCGRESLITGSSVLLYSYMVKVTAIGVDFENITS